MKKLLLSLILAQGLIAAPIHDAARSGNLDELERILSQNSSSGDLDENYINAVDIYGHTPLHLAAIVGNAEIVKMLISHDADVNAADDYDYTPLHLASESGNAEIAQLLITAGANIHAVDRFGCTPLHKAARNGHAEIAKMLIKHGANVNAIDGCGRTPLHFTASHENIVRILLEDPLCDHTITNNNNNIPEEIALSQGYQEIAAMLHNAPSVNKKIVNSGRGLQLSAIRVANKKGVYEEDYNKFPYMVRNLITNISKDKKPSSLNEDKAGPSGYHSDGEELQQERCSIL